MAELFIGRVTHCYSGIGVAALRLQAPLHKGDHVHFVGHTTYLERTIAPMELEKVQSRR